MKNSNNKEVQWYHFWNPRSGLAGGAIIGLIVSLTISISFKLGMGVFLAFYVGGVIQTIISFKNEN